MCSGCRQSRILLSFRAPSSISERRLWERLGRVVGPIHTRVINSFGKNEIRLRGDGNVRVVALKSVRAAPSSSESRTTKVTGRSPPAWNAENAPTAARIDRFVGPIVDYSFFLPSILAKAHCVIASNSFGSNLSGSSVPNAVGVSIFQC